MLYRILTAIALITSIDAYLVAQTFAAPGHTIEVRTENNNPGPNHTLHRVCLDDTCAVSFAGETSSSSLFPDAEPFFSATAAATLLTIEKELSRSDTGVLALLSSLNQNAIATNKLVTQQINTFNQDLRNSISASFDKLPQQMADSDTIKQLKADILKQVDDKLKTMSPPASPPAQPTPSRQ
jgi:hypothetical protein